MSEETREVYERTRLGQSVTLGGRPVVLVVDFSRGFTDPECTMGPDLTQEVGAPHRLLTTAHERGIPIIFTTIGFEHNLKDGATTSGCIRATAVDLLQYGYPTLVPRECVGDRAQDPHDANLVDIQAKYADVVSIEEALSYVESVSRKSGASV